MAKTKEELNTLKVEYETLNKKLKELTEEELNMVTGGDDITGLDANGSNQLFSSTSVNIENDRIMRDAKITEICD